MESVQPGAPQPVPASPSHFAARLERTDTACVLVVGGELDYVTGPLLHAEINTVLTEAPTLVILDLTEVQFLGSAGIGELVTARRRAAAQGTVMRVVAAGPVGRVLHLTSLTSALSVYPTRDDALTAP